MNLRDYMKHFKSTRERFSRIFEITRQLVGILKYVHAARRTYNDIKYDNIMVSTNGDILNRPSVSFIDFGFVDKFYKDSGEHIDENT